MRSKEAPVGRSMLVTQNVVRDLVPLYFDGEASADSRALIEKWFATDPDFARWARRQSDAVNDLASADSTPVHEEAIEESLRRAHRIILIREVSLGLAGALSLFFIAMGAFALFAPRTGYEASNGLIALSVCFLLAAMNWVIYFNVRRRTSPGLP